MGFTGKQCIHPAQVPIVQEAFSPAPEKIEWASKLITAFNEHQSSGHVSIRTNDNLITDNNCLRFNNVVTLVVGSFLVRRSHDRYASPSPGKKHRRTFAKPKNHCKSRLRCALNVHSNAEV